MVFVVGETDCVPLVGSVPLQPLLAVQEVALVELQESVEDCPFVMVPGLAERVTVGAEAAVTVTVADWLADPPAPVHAREYVVVVPGETERDPEVPVAVKLVPVQEVAFVELQLSVEDCPPVMVPGLAESETVGAGTVTVTVVDCVADPPAPVQVRV